MQAELFYARKNGPDGCECFQTDACVKVLPDVCSSESASDELQRTDHIGPTCVRACVRAWAL